MQVQMAEVKLADHITQDCGNLITRAITHACIVDQKPFLLELDASEAAFVVGQQRTNLPSVHIGALKNEVRLLTLAYSQALEKIFREGLPPLARHLLYRPTSKSVALDAPGRNLPVDNGGCFGHRLAVLVESACSTPLRLLQAQQFAYRSMHKSTVSLPLGALTFVCAIRSAFESVYTDQKEREALFALTAICFVRCLNESLQKYSKRFDVLVAAENEAMQDAVHAAVLSRYEAFEPTYPLGI